MEASPSLLAVMPCTGSVHLLNRPNHACYRELHQLISEPVLNEIECMRYCILY